MASTSPRPEPNRQASRHGSAADYDGRLIAEAVRSYEAAHGAPIDDPAAEALARDAAGDFEQRIIVRARALDLAKALMESLRHLRAATRLTVGLGTVIAFGAGVATARTALAAPAGTPVNFHWALLALLGVESIALLLWIAFTVASPGAPATVSLGGLMSGLGRRAARWLHPNAIQAAMAQAAGAIMTRGAIARWTLGAITHGLWLAFLAGALAMTLLMLSTQQVSFAWQTTILSEQTYLPVTEALAALPRLAGFETPTAEEIRASRWTGQGVPAVAASGAWAGLLAGSLVVYGLVPRAVLLVLCLVARARAARGFRLDLGLPEYLRLRERLMPSVQREGIVDADEGPIGDAETPIEAVPTIEFEGPVALLGLELESPQGGWPPTVPGISWRDLGPVDSREERDRAIDAIRSSAPGLLLVAVSLLTTPDRGIGVYLSKLRQASDGPMALLLSDGKRLRARYQATEAAQRVDDWRRLGGYARIPANWAVELDLPDPSENDKARLARLLGAEAA